MAAAEKRTFLHLDGLPLSLIASHLDMNLETSAVANNPSGLLKAGTAKGSTGHPSLGDELSAAFCVVPPAPPPPPICQQPIADDPYLDIQINALHAQRLRAVAVIAPANESPLGYFQLQSGPDLTALQNCNDGYAGSGATSRACAHEAQPVAS